MRTHQYEKVRANLNHSEVFLKRKENEMYLLSCELYSISYIFRQSLIIQATYIRAEALSIPLLYR